MNVRSSWFDGSICSLTINKSKMADAYTMNKCTYCQEDITGLSATCCECEDFFLCLLCFVAGPEIGPHKNYHDYEFTDDWLNTLIIKGEGDWLATEELRLLNNIDVLGFGNWDKVSSIMNHRTPEEVKEHYIYRYMDGIIGRVLWGRVTRPELPKMEKLPEPKAYSRLPPIDITLEEAQLLCYMPKRDDFDGETSTDIEAEQLVSSLNGVAIDNEDLDTALKLAQVDMYMRRLRERARRKRIVRDYQIVSKFFASHRKHTTKPSLTKEQREFRDRMRVFSQFSSATDHECLISGLEREQELRLRLSELARYRQAGLVHLDECLHYEQHLAFDRKGGQTVGSTSTGATTPATHQWKQAKSGSSGFDPSYPEARPVVKKYEEDDVVLNSIVQKFMSLIDVICTKENHEEDLVGQMMLAPPQVQQGSLSILQSQDNSWQELLSSNELQLCSSLNLNPIQYITMKAVILRDHIAPECSMEVDTSSEGPCRETNGDMWDSYRVNAITSYLESSGWLT